MQMQLQHLFDALPAFRGHQDVIVSGNQTATQILNQLLNAHIKYEKDYDKIAPVYAGGNVPKKLFNFCKEHLPYESEKGRKQTTRSPGGILTMSTWPGNDCKHYSSYIAGVLDALNRTGKYNFDWYYRFAQYDGGKEFLPDHVFVVVKQPGGSELWLDPAPIYDPDTGRLIDRYYNDREVIPTNYRDRKPETLMSVVDISGPRSSRMGCTSMRQCTVQAMAGRSINGFTDIVSDVTDFVSDTATSGGPEVQAATGIASSIANLLPDGGLKDFLNSFLKDPVGSIKTLIFGRTYTSGAYALGEIYMRNILGYTQIQSRTQVPDSIIVQAETFWTTALGVLIGSNDHLDQLVISPQNYLNWSTDFRSFTMDQVTRAHNILKAIGYPTSDRNSTYSLPVFGSIPYIYPIPTYCLNNCSPVPLFTGTHPITRISLVSGYPIGTPTPTGSGSLPVNNSGGSSAGTGATGNTGAGTGPGSGTQQAGMGTVGWVVLGGLAVTALVMANKPKKH